MTKTFTNITHSNFRCDISVSCPGIHRSEDGKTFVIIGERVVSEIADKAGPGEGAVEISSDLVLASLGVNDLVEATEKTLADIRLFSKCFDDGSASKDFCIGVENRLRSVLNKINGGA